MVIRCHNEHKERKALWTLCPFRLTIFDYRSNRLITEAIVSRLHFGTFRNEILNSLRSLMKMTPDSYVVIHTWSLRGYPKDCDFKSNPNLTPERSATKSNKSEPLIFLTSI